MLTCPYERSVIRTCPLFDAASFNSFERIPPTSPTSQTSSSQPQESSTAPLSLSSSTGVYTGSFDQSFTAYGVVGGTARGYGRCRNNMQAGATGNSGQICENSPVFARFTPRVQDDSGLYTGTLVPGSVVPSEDGFAAFER